MPTLLEILPEDLRDGLTPAEKVLLENAGKGAPADFRIDKKVLKGEPADYCLNVDDPDNPANSAIWGIERTIRAELLYWLCTNVQAIGLVHAKGINIRGAKVEGTINFDSATLLHPLGLSLCSLGNIGLLDSETRTIAFSGCSIKSLYADRLVVKGNLFLRGIKTKGDVRLPGAIIDGSLVCDGAEFDNPEDNAFFADQLVVKGSFSLSGVKAKGKVRLLSVEIGGQLDCTEAEFECKKGNAINLQNARINDLLFKKVRIVKGSLYFAGAHIAVLVDDETSWPKKSHGKLNLVGFEYSLFAGGQAPITAEKRLKWIRLQDPKYFSLQPYEQLAKVFRQMGHESDAREVQIAKNYDLYRFGKLSWHSRRWNEFLDFTVGYGYQPLRALLLLAFIAFVGMDVFLIPANMQPAKDRAFMNENYETRQELPKYYPEYNPLVYSLDTLIPVLDLHQEEYWIPKAGFVRGYLWVHIFCGWILTTLGIASLTGLINKE